MPLVIVESPYSGNVTENLAYLTKCLRDCLDRGESPYASHGLLPGALDDSTPADRQRGIAAGYAWWWAADKVVFYVDLGWSPGMHAAMERLQRRPAAIPFELRRIL